MEGILVLLIYLAILAIFIYIVIWALQSIVGIALPGRVIQLVWVIFVLVALLWLVQSMGGFSLPEFRSN